MVYIVNVNIAQPWKQPSMICLKNNIVLPVTIKYMYMRVPIVYCLLGIFLDKTLEGLNKRVIQALYQASKIQKIR